MNAAKKRAKFAREYHSTERREWVERLPCCACSSPGPCENHHVRSDGMGRKAGYEWIVPLCPRCHHEYHYRGRDTMLASRTLQLRINERWVQFATWEECAVSVQSMWEAYYEGMP